MVGVGLVRKSSALLRETGVAGQGGAEERLGVAAEVRCGAGAGLGDHVGRQEAMLFAMVASGAVASVHA